MAKNNGNGFSLGAALEQQIAEAVKQEIASQSQAVVEEAIRSALSDALSAFGGDSTQKTPARRPVAPRRASITPVQQRRDRRTCNVSGCNNPYRSMGYCAKHYQAARNHGWPFPAPENYTPPATSDYRPRAERSDKGAPRANNNGQ